MINIVDILKDCPKGTKLYSSICGECELAKIYNSLGFDVIDKMGTTFNFSYDGRYNLNGECCIFPSKENRDWNNFQRPFMDGDIISNNSYIVIFHRFGNTLYTLRKDLVYYHCWYNKKYDNSKFKIDFGIGYGTEYRFAIEEEKQKLFNVIEKHGYKWNVETKTLEKLIPNKFDITTLKPFDKVLVRQSYTDSWKPAFWGRYIANKTFPFITSFGSTTQAIPFKSNEWLVGTTDDCDDYYKTW